MIIESEQNARQVFIYLSSFPVQLPAKKMPLVLVIYFSTHTNLSEPG